MSLAVELVSLVQLLERWADVDDRGNPEFERCYSLCQRIEGGVELTDGSGVCYEIKFDDLDCCGNRRPRGIVQACVQDAIKERGWGYSLHYYPGEEKHNALVVPGLRHTWSGFTDDSAEALTTAYLVALEADKETAQ